MTVGSSLSSQVRAQGVTPLDFQCQLAVVADIAMFTQIDGSRGNVCPEFVDGVGPERPLRESSELGCLAVTNKAMWRRVICGFVPRNRICMTANDYAVVYRDRYVLVQSRKNECESRVHLHGPMRLFLFLCLVLRSIRHRSRRSGVRSPVFLRRFID